VSSASDFSPVIVNQECIITEVLNSLLSATSPSPLAAGPSDFGVTAVALSGGGLFRKAVNGAVAGTIYRTIVVIAM